VNFAETLPRLAGKLEGYARRSSADEQRSRYGRIIQTLQDRLQVARRARDRLRALTEAGFPVADNAAQAQQLNKVLAAMHRATKGDLLRLLDQQKRWDELKAAEKALDTAIAAAYRQARFKLLPPPAPAFHARLARSGPLKEAYDRLLQADAALAKMLPETTPATLANRLTEAVELRARRDADRAALDREIPETVRALLSRIESGEAGLADVTSEALAWLREHQADTEIGLAFRPSGRQS
jgi:hypothetical protein